MTVKKYLKYLNNEDVGGFAIDSYHTKAKPFSVAYPNETIEEPEIDKTKRILIDLDGVIHKYSEGFKDGTLYDPPIDGSKEAIEELKENGYEIVIFTARLSTTSNGQDEVNKQKVIIKNWLKKYGIKVDGVTSEKLQAELYVDDRGVHFTGNWTKALSEIKLRLGND